MSKNIKEKTLCRRDENIFFSVGNNITPKELRKRYKDALDKNIAELIFFYGSEVLKKKYYKDKADLYELYENLLKASIELNLIEWKDCYFEKIYDKFGKANGIKINLLKALVCESKNDNQGALTIYKTLLEKNPCHLTVRRKCINIKKQLEKDINKIIYLYNEHLKEFPTDIESWHDLAEIYLKNGSFKYALYCFEEILLNNPKNIYVVLSIAEIYATLNNFELSSKYFCFAHFLKPFNIRALWGIILINRKRYEHIKKKTTVDNVDVVLTIKCINTLYKMYSESNINLFFKETILKYLEKLKAHFN